MLPKSNNGGNRRARLHDRPKSAGKRRDGKSRRDPPETHARCMNARDPCPVLAILDSPSPRFATPPCTSPWNTAKFPAPRNFPVESKLSANGPERGPRKFVKRRMGNAMDGMPWPIERRGTIIAAVPSGEARWPRIERDSSRRVRNNLLNYRMPMVTSTRREAGVGGGILRWCEKGEARDGRGQVLYGNGVMTRKRFGRDRGGYLAKSRAAMWATALTKLTDGTRVRASRTTVDQRSGEGCFKYREREFDPPESKVRVRGRSDSVSIDARRDRSAVFSYASRGNKAIRQLVMWSNVLCDWIVEQRTGMSDVAQLSRGEIWILGVV